MIDFMRLQRSIRARRHIQDAFWLNAFLDARVWPEGMSVNYCGNLVVPEIGVDLTPRDKHLIKYLDLLKQSIAAGSVNLTRSRSGALLIHTAEQDRMHDVTAEIATATDYATFDEILVRHVYRIRPLQPVVVCDIGMNVGFASLAFAAQPDVIAVYGYEPVRASYNQASRNFMHNPGIAEKIRAYSYGIDAINREAELPYSEEHLTSAGLYSQSLPGLDYLSMKETARIELRAVDEVMHDISEDHPDSPLVIKMDCEGAEKDIIPAMHSNGWLHKIDMALIETHFKDTVEIVALLNEAGLRLFHTAVSIPLNISLIYASR